MKKPANLPIVGALALPCLLLSSPKSSADDWPAIYESYDNNSLGVMVGQPTGGYGVTGLYNFQGNDAAARAAFQVVAGGLAFGSFNTITSASKCVQVNAGDTACGVGIQVDGGKTVGDYQFFVYDKLYCSYLVNFSNFSSLAGARAEVRTSTSASGGSNFQVHTDTGTANAAQPGLAFSGTNYARSSTSLAKDTTYLMIGRFAGAGNQLSVAPTATWTAGTNTITVSSSSGIAIGQLAIGTGLADNSIVTGINGTTVTLSENTVSGGASATTVHFRVIVNKSTPANVSYNHTTAPQTLTFISSFISTADISVGMSVLPAASGIPVNAKVTGITQSGGYVTAVTIDQNLTATSTGRSVTFQSTVPLTATWTSGQSVITVNQNPGIQIGQAVIGAGIAPDTSVADVSGNQITLSIPTTAAGSATPVHFLQRTGESFLYALTLPQYESFIASGTTEAARQDYLDTTAIGTASNQVSVRITGLPSTTGSIEFGQGRYVHIVASGLNASRQAYKMDELRYGFTLNSVTQPAALATAPPSDPAAFEGFSGIPSFSYFYHDSGYGWKSGWYEVEETAATPGAFGTPMNVGTEITPGGGAFLSVLTRSDQGTDQGIRRRPDPAIVDMTKPYTVTFDYQLTGVLSSFNAFSDRIQIGADCQVASGGAITQSGNFGPNPTRPGLTANPITAGTAINWMVGVVGADDGQRGITETYHRQRWYFFDFDENNFIDGSNPKNYFVGANMVPTNPRPEDPPGNDEIPRVTGGGIYSFKIEVNPLTFTYRGTVYYRPNPTSPISARFSRGGLRFRDNIPANTLFWGVSKSNTDIRSFSLDNVRVSPGVDFFPDWIASYPSITNSGDQTRSADPDQDGRKNFLEYALDGNPASGASSGKIIESVSTIGPDNYHTLTVPIRAGMTFSTSSTSGEEGDLVSTFTNNEGIKYRIEGSYDLVNWNAEVIEVSPALATEPALSPSPGYAYRTFRLADPISATHPKGFLRVMVESTK